MKKIWLLVSLLTLGLSGCFVAPHDRGHDDGYRNSRDHRQDNHGKDRDGHDERRDDRYGRQDGYR